MTPSSAKTSKNWAVDSESKFKAPYRRVLPKITPTRISPITPGMTILFFIAAVAHSQRRPATFAMVKMIARSSMIIPMSSPLIAMAILDPNGLSIIFHLVQTYWMSDVRVDYYWNQ